MREHNAYIAALGGIDAYHAHLDKIMGIPSGCAEEDELSSDYEDGGYGDFGYSEQDCFDYDYFEDDYEYWKGVVCVGLPHSITTWVIYSCALLLDSSNYIYPVYDLPPTNVKIHPDEERGTSGPEKLLDPHVIPEDVGIFGAIDEDGNDLVSK